MVYQFISDEQLNTVVVQGRHNFDLQAVALFFKTPGLESMGGVGGGKS